MIMNTNNSTQELVQKSDKSFVLSITITKDSIQDTYKKVLSQIAPKIKIDGFRPGKAPIEQIEAKLNPEEVLKEVITDLLSKVYGEKLTQYKLKPIIEPKVKIITTPVTVETDWQVEYESCEQPEIKIDPKLYEEIKKLDKTSEKLLDQIVEQLEKFAQVEIPALLTPEKDWKINFAIDQVGKEQKIQIGESDLKPAIEKNPSLGQNINLLYYLVYQQKVLDYLKNLI